MLNQEPSPGWVKLRCRNHPSLSWTMKDPSIKRISQNRQLIFEGDAESGKYGMTANDIPAEVFASSEELQAKYVFECPCPFSDLEIVAK